MPATFHPAVCMLICPCWKYVSIKKHHDQPILSIGSSTNFIRQALAKEPVD